MFPSSARPDCHEVSQLNSELQRLELEVAEREQQLREKYVSLTCNMYISILTVSLTANPKMTHDERMLSDVSLSRLQGTCSEESGETERCREDRGTNQGFYTGVEGIGGLLSLFKGITVYL